MKDPRRGWEDEGIQLAYTSFWEGNPLLLWSWSKCVSSVSTLPFWLLLSFKGQLHVVVVLHRSLNWAVNTQTIKSHHTPCCRHNLNYATWSTLLNVQFNADMHLTQGNCWKSSLWFANHIYLYTGTINSTASSMSSKLKQTNKLTPIAFGWYLIREH